MTRVSQLGEKTFITRVGQGGALISPDTLPHSRHPPRTQTLPYGVSSLGQHLSWAGVPSPSIRAIEHMAWTSKRGAISRLLVPQFPSSANGLINRTYLAELVVSMAN